MRPVLYWLLGSWFVNNRMVFSERNNPRKVPVGKHQQMLRDFAFRFADAIVFQTEDANRIFQTLYKDEGISFQIRLMAIYQNLTKGNAKRLL